MPQSLNASPGVHISNKDGLDHRSETHYTKLCRVVLDEFGVSSDSASINLVFIDEETREALSVANPDRFGKTPWVGAFVNPGLIFMVGSSESDDTFIHEYLHSLQVRGLVFQDVPVSAVHTVIQESEGLLLGSASYLQMLKVRPQ